MISDREIKKTAQNSLMKSFGFAPKLKDIVLLEATECGSKCQYVRFRIGDHEYAYDGFTIHHFEENERNVREELRT